MGHVVFTWLLSPNQGGAFQKPPRFCTCRVGTSLHRVAEKNTVVWTNAMSIYTALPYLTSTYIVRGCHKNQCRQLAWSQVFDVVGVCVTCLLDVSPGTPWYGSLDLILSCDIVDCDRNFQVDLEFLTINVS